MKAIIVRFFFYLVLLEIIAYCSLWFFVWLGVLPKHEKVFFILLFGITCYLVIEWLIEEREKNKKFAYPLNPNKLKKMLYALLLK